MRYIKGSDSRQMTMGICSIEEEVAENSPARFIEVFVDSLDMESLEIKRIKPAPTGRPPYAPQDMIKLSAYPGHRRESGKRRPALGRRS